MALMTDALSKALPLLPQRKMLHHLSPTQLTVSQLSSPKRQWHLHLHLNLWWSKK